MEIAKKYIKSKIWEKNIKSKKMEKMNHLYSNLYFLLKFSGFFDLIFYCLNVSLFLFI
jgi:hypothetical protein